MSTQVLIRSEPTDMSSGDGGMTLAVTDGEGYQAAILLLAREMLEREEQGVLVSANRPCHVVQQALEDAGIATDGFHFIDCVSSLTGMMPPREPQVLHIESPTMLEKMALRADQLLRRLPTERRFFILDSLSTLCVYNGPDAVCEVAHGLINRLREMGVRGAFLLVEKQADDRLLDRVQPLFDDTVRL